MQNLTPVHVLILNAGARLSMKPIDEQCWDEFSSAWNTDVRAGLVGMQAALKIPMKPYLRSYFTA